MTGEKLLNYNDFQSCNTHTYIHTPPHNEEGNPEAEPTAYSGFVAMNGKLGRAADLQQSDLGTGRGFGLLPEEVRLWRRCLKDSLGEAFALMLCSPLLHIPKEFSQRLCYILVCMELMWLCVHKVGYVFLYP